MNCSAAILRQWRREDPDRLLQAALSQAECLAEMAPELDALQAKNASLHQQLEVKTKRIAQLEEALAAAQRAAHRQAAPFRVEPQKRSVAPLTFSFLQNIRPMIETVPLAEAAEAYGSMMRNEARFRIVLVTGQ
jgi:hypothetical protein